MTKGNFFTRHLNTVNENYFEHFFHAMSFTVSMFIGAFACLLHTIFPFLFEKTGSKIINTLYDRMVVNRAKQTPRNRTRLEAEERAAIEAPAAE